MKFYKYCPINNYTLYNLSTNSLHHAEPKELNDPFDSSISVKFDAFSRDDILRFTENRKGKFETLRWALEKGTTDIQEIKELLSYVFVEEYFSDIRICSFTTEYKNPVMWAHYASNYSGICIGYQSIIDNEINYILCDDGNKAKIEKVRYLKIAGKIKYEPKPNLSTVREKLFLRKSIAWKYENEYRIIENNSMIKSAIYLKDNVIDEIIFGTKSTYIEINLVKSLAEKHNSNIQYYKIEVQDDKLEKVKLT